MKRIILIIAALGFAASFFSSCDTSIEPINLQPANTYTEEYYANLRAYKDTFKERSLCFVWFAEYNTVSTSPAFRFAGLPDSVDVCSLWGGIPDPEKNPLPYKEMWEMRNKKGTRLVIPTIIRIMENENYKNFGLTAEDVTSDKTTIDPYGIYPDWCVLYGDYLLGQMWDNNLDGLDLDFEPEGDYLDSSKIGIFVRYIGQFIGPMSSNPEKLFILDGWDPGAACEPYLDYYVVQRYKNTVGEGDFNGGTWPNYKKVFTENIGEMWQTGGNLRQQAAFQPSSGGHKGGFGAFYCQRDYNTSDSGANKAVPYGHLRAAIQLQNPARTE